jgi:hypothetical protein
VARNNRDRPSLRWGISRNEAAAEGYRSTYECAIARRLRAEGVAFEYEAQSFPVFVKAGRSYSCGEPGCGGGARRKINYTPDFLFNDRTFIVEAKGRLDAGSRAKAIAFRTQYPDIEYALLFEENNRISRVSRTHYTDWADANEILCAVGLMPPEWIREVK